MVLWCSVCLFVSVPLSLFFSSFVALFSLTFFLGAPYGFGLDSEWMFANLVLLNEKLGVMRVITSQ